jgi:hypothetical protein
MQASLEEIIPDISQAKDSIGQKGYPHPYTQNQPGFGNGTDQNDQSQEEKEQTGDNLKVVASG